MGRLRGFLWLIAGVVVAALAGGVAFVALSRATAREAQQAEVAAPEENVVVAVRTIEQRAVLVAEDLQIVSMPVDAIPETAVRDTEDAVGKIALVEMYAGEPILQPRLLDPNVTPPTARLAVFVAEDEVLLALPAGDLINQLGVLKSGDHVDFLYTYQLPIDRETGLLPFQQEQAPAEGESAQTEPSETVTFSLMQNVTIAQVVRQLDEEGQPTGAPRGLLLTVAPQDALVLKYMKDIGATIDLVLRAPDVEGEFTVEPVDLDYIINGYIAPGETVP